MCSGVTSLNGTGTPHANVMPYHEVCVGISPVCFVVPPDAFRRGLFIYPGFYGFSSS